MSPAVARPRCRVATSPATKVYVNLTPVSPRDMMVDINVTNGSTQEFTTVINHQVPGLTPRIAYTKNITPWNATLEGILYTNKSPYIAPRSEIAFYNAVTNQPISGPLHLVNGTTVVLRANIINTTWG